ncbi:MAG: molybdopterin-guanine dinucleotide biosynthesis protein MobB [Halanaerobiales bacterium]|nr:molybdopterin-guanine dinucleotide biosynthesis protein MobB [Halanaerobiales bacterium]
MKVFSVFGISGTGKTTTIENIIRELKKRRYSVGSVKEIHFEEFAIDLTGSNTDRHRKAGSELVTARGFHETDILYPEKLSIDEILSHYHHDYVVLEGVIDRSFPRIITASTIEEIDERIDGYVFAISGRIANELSEYRGLPVINSMTDVDVLVDLIEEKVFHKLPDFPAKCCKACGLDCRELGIKILKGEAKREDCVISKGNVKLFIDQKEVEMVSFVQRILRNAVLGVVKELDGYKPGVNIEVKIDGNIDE